MKRAQMTHYSNLPQVPATMPKGERGLMVALLKEIRDTATMDDADFSPELKEATRIWRESWLIAPLDDLIARYESDAITHY